MLSPDQQFHSLLCPEQKIHSSDPQTVATKTDAMKTEFDEKTSPSPPGTVIDISVAESQAYSRPKAWLTKLSAWGIEVHGVEPVPLEERTDKRFINVFFVWFTMSTNLLPYVNLTRWD